MNLLRHFFKKESKVILRDNDLNAFGIPEPTRSLLFITNEPLSKMKDAGQLKIVVSFNGIKQEDTADIFSEPSLIWTKLPIKENNSLETRKIYYPSYAKLDPICRFQYLSWLRDVIQETNLSYVFLYYYGLERHLLVGDYDLAVDEIIRLIKAHDKGTFKSYATTALLASSVYRKRFDILSRAPFVLDELTNIGLFLRWQIGKDLKAGELMRLSNKVGFKNKNYIKNKPDLFKRVLDKEIESYAGNSIKIIESINFSLVSWKDEIYFANLSVPGSIRTIRTPQIIENKDFKKVIFNLLSKTYNKIKNGKYINNKPLSYG